MSIISKSKADLILEAQQYHLLVSQTNTKEEIMDILAGYLKTNYVGTNGTHRKPLEQLPCQLARNSKDLRDASFNLLMLDEDYIAEIKYDGCRAKLHFGEEENRMDSRHRTVVDYCYNERTDNFPHLRDHPCDDLRDTVLDGEILMDVPTLQIDRMRTSSTLNLTSAVFNSKPPRATELQLQHGNAKYIVFDIIKFKGIEMRNQPFRTRRNTLIEVLRKLLDLQSPLFQYLSLAQLFRLNDSRNTWEIKIPSFTEIYDQAIANHCEGIMLKQLAGPYSHKPGARSKVMYKWKNAETIDAFIVGAIPSIKGKYAGLVGSVLCNVYNEHDEQMEIAAVIPGDDHIRQLLSGPGGTLNPDYVGKVVELKYQEWTKNDRLRHAVLGKWRPDKNPEQCIMSFGAGTEPSPY